MKIASFISSAATAALLTVSVGASDFDAMDSNDQVLVKVQTADLNLESTQGSKVLYSRLKREATEVCGSTNFRKLRSISRVQDNRACYDEALSNAVEETQVQPLMNLHVNSKSQS